MGKEYSLYCSKHGYIRIEVEKPPVKFTAAPFCPFCLNRLMKPGKDMKKKWQPNYVAEGAPA